MAADFFERQLLSGVFIVDIERKAGRHLGTGKLRQQEETSAEQRSEQEQRPTGASEQQENMDFLLRLLDYFSSHYT